MRVLAVLLLTVVFYCPVLAQNLSAAKVCSKGRVSQYERSAAKLAVASPDEDKYDVQHVFLDLEMNNTSVAIAGSATTTAKVLEPNFALYVTELNEELTIDSIVINNVTTTFTREGLLVNVLMPTILQTDDVFEAKVFYHGMPTGGSVQFFLSGMNNAIAGEWGKNVTYTLSEPYNANDWWPCKQSLPDKIESADIWVTVPDSLMAGSNGLLQNTTVLPDNKVRYEWKTKYPMAYYLISISIADYTDYSYNTTLPDGSSVLVQNFIYSNPEFLTQQKARIDTTGVMLQLFSELFGTYPFKDEKYGHCMSPMFGGMEHQTMSTVRHFGGPLIAHELAHQWFGDNVTCASWKDIWINEGFASYSEYLFAERFWGETNAASYIAGQQNAVLNDTNKKGSVYVSASDTINPYRVFETRLSYEKASTVIHMIRYVMNDDALFFRFLKTIQQQYASANASTEQVQLIAEQVSGISFSTFFKQWIYGEGYPIYNVSWNQIENKVYVKVEHRNVLEDAIALYEMPVEIALQSATNTDIKRELNDKNEQLYTFDSPVEINDVLFDPKNWLLNEQIVTRDYTLGLGKEFNEVTVFPNPTKNLWQIGGLNANSELVITDVSGRVVWQKRQTNTTEGISASGFARGIYILHIVEQGNKVATKKLLKL